VSTHRVSLWRTPRSRSLLLVAALVALSGAVALAAQVWTDGLWFREVGREDVFWATLRWKVLARGVPAFGSAFFLLANFAMVERAMAAHAPRRPARLLAYPAAAIAAGLVSGLWLGDGVWRLLALWAGRSDFGVEDPLFGRDAGFFVFSLPLYEWASRWLLDTLAMAAMATVAAYVAAGGLRIARPRLLVPRARTHLLVLGALALLVMAWRYRLDAYALALPHGDAAGAGYTEAHVRLPALRILTGVSLAGAALLLYAAVRRVPRRPLAALIGLVALALTTPGVVSRLVERFEVAPQALARERPYVDHEIAATRRAFALDRVQVRGVSGSGMLSRADIETHRSTLENVPLWDHGVLRPALDDLQSIGRYYSFPSLTLDRYTVDGSPRVVTLAARQLDLRALGRDARGWANDRFAYTHGYGVVTVSAPSADHVGQPRFSDTGFGSRPGLLGLREPRVYFSERTGPGPEYLVVQSRRGEVDRPVAGSSGYHYGGDGGVALSSALRRAAFAVRFGDARLLLSETVTGRSRILLHRGVRDRLRTLAPFLDWDSHPQTVVLGGHVQFLFHGYTTSAQYPYSAPLRTGVNYLRAGVVAAVDAFDGAIALYADDEDDPVLRAWRSAFPSLFQPSSAMSAELRAHLRYPRRLFTAQAELYATYHAAEPTAFWNGADAWQVPQQIAGPLEDAGEIHFPGPKPRVDSDAWTVPSRYLLTRLPGDASERFALVTPFTPRGRQNLVGYLAGSVAPDGGQELALLSFPRDRLELGPAQATRRILASPGVSARLEIVNRESSDLGEDSVSRTVLGAPRLVPVGDALVHVQPIYLTAGGGGVPRLQLVTVLANGRVGYGRDLETALRRAVGPR
jgi:uncharacterized membrane protein (UPF0182 family)